MRTMIWKELRENLKWASLAFLCLLLAEFYSLSTLHEPYSEDFENVTLCSPAFLLVTSFGCSAVGLALAIVQILPELRRDQWAALLHRPVSRSVIFLGKAAAGLLLYFWATTLAFAASVLYVSVPGAFAAPLVPGMLLPGLSDLFIGPVFYFGAILLCLHRGRWFGSRGAIALSIAAVLVLHLVVSWMFSLPLLAAIVFFLASWGAMLSNGTVRERPRPARLALVLIILAGAETVVLLVMLSLQFVPAKAAPVDFSSRFVIAADDQVFLLRSNGVDGFVITDLDGKPLNDSHSPGPSELQGLREPESFMWRPRESFSQNLRNSLSYVQYQNDVLAKEVWYLLRQENYFVGYDKMSHRKIAICDVEGFKPPNAEPKPFPAPLQTSMYGFQNPHLDWSGPQLYRLDFPARDRAVFTMPDDRIYGAANLLGSYRQDKPGLIAAALQNEVRIYSPEGSLMTRLPYPHDPDVWIPVSLDINEAQDRLYFESEAILYNNVHPNASLPAFLDEYDLHGNRLRSLSHLNPPTPRMTEGWLEHTMALTSPGLLVLAGTIYSQLFHHSVSVIANATLGQLTLPQPTTDAPFIDLVLLLVLAVGLAAVTFIWARRAGFSSWRARRWAFFVLCFGVPGLLAFRLAADWPVRVRCPHCGRRRTIETMVCEHCHQPWLPVSRNGAEIFDSPLETERAG